VGWQGGRDLAASAFFTPAFCNALLEQWERWYEPTVMPKPPVVEIDSDVEMYVG